jgi:hypothetical protein
MTQNQKAILAITDKGVIAFEENDTVYIEVEETPFEISEFEINFQANQQFNSMMAQDISFVPQIQQKMQLAEYYKSLAEQIYTVKL